MYSRMLVVITPMTSSICPTMYKTRVTVERKIRFTASQPSEFMMFEVYFYELPDEDQIDAAVHPYIDIHAGWFILGWEEPHLV